jgi:hypothetical protein
MFPSLRSASVPYVTDNESEITDDVSRAFDALLRAEFFEHPDNPNITNTVVIAAATAAVVSKNLRIMVDPLG